MKPSQDSTRIETAVEDAQLEFWKSIAESFPEIKTGDFEMGMEMDDALIGYVRHWLELNQGA